MEEFQGDSNEKVYTLKTINRKLKVKYGDRLRFTSCEGRPSIMLLHEGGDQIVLESSLEMVSNSCNVEEDLKDFVFVDQGIAQCLQESSEREEFYPYPSDLTLENLSALIPRKLSYFLDAIFTKSRTSTAQEKKNSRKVTIAHVIMQWCKKEGHQSSLLLAIDFFIGSQDHVVVVVVVSFIHKKN